MMFAQHFLLLLSTLKMRNLLLFSFTLLFVCLSFVYITESINDILKKVVLADYVVKTINTKLSPTYFAYNPANKDLYVNAASNTILVINSTSNVVKKYIGG